MVFSFFNKFGALLGMKPLTFAKFEQMLGRRDSGESAGGDLCAVHPELVEMHVSLLRRLRFTGARNDERWETFLLKFCAISPQLEQEMLLLQRYKRIT